MNIAEAIYHSSVSPENIGDLISNILVGFKDAGIRKLSYFDLFIIIPFYSSSYAQKEFQKQFKFDKVRVFQNKIERHPEIYLDFNFKYENSVSHIKLGILHLLENKIIEIDNDLNIIHSLIKNNNDIIYKMAKVFSIKTTSSLYNFFRVDINAIYNK